MTRPIDDLSRRRWLRAVAPAALLLNGSLAGRAWGQSAYPNHPVELVVPWAPGGGVDVVTRAFSAAMGGHFPQPMLVVNRPGATGSIGLGSVAKAKPDGYTIAMSTPELTFLEHLGLAKFSYRDFRPVARLNADPVSIIVGADSPWNTLDQFLDASRKPDANIRLGNSGVGSTYHLAAAALADKTGAKFNHIPFAGGAPGLVALLGGHIDSLVISTAEASTYLTAGKLKGICVMADKRLTGAFESVTSLKERGIDLSLALWRGMCVPRETPDAVVAVLKEATAKAVKEPVWLESLRKLNFSTDTYADAATLQTVMERDSALFKDLAAKVTLS